MSAIRDQLPALQIVLPLMAAPVCVLVRKPRVAWAIAALVTWTALLISSLLLAQVVESGTISYHVGGWAPPWGIELRVDVLNAFVLLIVSGISATVIVATPRSLERDVAPERHYLFYALYLLCMTGLAGIAITGDAFNVFVFLEISSMSAYGLIALGPTRRALVSSFQYLVMGTLGGTFFLLGVGMLFMVTGTLNMVDIAARLSEHGVDRTVLIALACIVAGLSIKVAIFPLHIWLPNAYTDAPATVTALLAATATKVAFYVLVRFIFGVFGVQLAFESLSLDAVLLPMALLAMFIASTVAIFQSDVKRMLAFSSVAQIGYMVLGLSFASMAGLTGAIAHLFNHAVMKSGLFLALACVVLRVGSTRLEDMRGLGRQMPFTMAAFVVGGLGLIGVPLTAGFVSKWYLVSAAIDDGSWSVAILILFSSLLAVLYIWRVVEQVYFAEAPERNAGVKEAPLSILIPTWVLIGATIYFGLDTRLTAGMAGRAATMLLEVAP